MSTRSYDEVEFGDDLPQVEPDVGLENVSRFCHATGMLAPRFLDHEKAKKEGLPGAIVPGIMSMAPDEVLITWEQVGHIRSLWLARHEEGCHSCQRKT